MCVVITIVDTDLPIEETVFIKSISLLICEGARNSLLSEMPLYCQEHAKGDIGMLGDIDNHIPYQTRGVLGDVGCQTSQLLPKLLVFILLVSIILASRFSLGLPVKAGVLIITCWQFWDF